MRNIFARLRRDEKGATMVEYGVCLLIVILAGTTAFQTLGAATAEQVGDACTIVTSVSTNATAGSC